MMNENMKREWLVFGVSIQGDSHLRAYTCNQDAIHWLPEKPDQLPIILSIADGHGSQNYFRSGVGSMLSVLAAEKAMLELPSLRQAKNTKVIDKNSDETLRIKIIKEYFLTKLIKKISWYWHEFLNLYQNLDSENNGLLVSGLESEIRESSRGDELNNLNFLPNEKFDFHQGKKRTQYGPYGSTLLTCAIADKFDIYLQLGDGTIGCVSEEGEFSVPVGERPKDLIANETYSLVSKDYVEKTRYGFESYLNKDKAHPAMIIMATDGLENAFVDGTVTNFALDIHSLLQKAAKDDSFYQNVNKQISQRLPEWAKKASNYTGDDITIGLIVRVSAYLGK